MRSKPVALTLGAFLLLAFTAGWARAAVIQVHMDKIVFMPKDFTAHVGDTIEWINDDIVAHTATARNKSFDVFIPVHAKKSTVVKAAGTIDYFCKLHPTMTGTITVTQ